MIELRLQRFECYVAKGIAMSEFIKKGKGATYIVETNNQLKSKEEEENNLQNQSNDYFLN